MQREWKTLAATLALTATLTLTGCLPAERIAIWECVHKHEQPNWQAPGRYPGGLGILRAAWRENGGLQFAPTGNLATPLQQMLVGEAIVARFGWKAWAPATRRACGLR